MNNTDTKILVEALKQEKEMQTLSYEITNFKTGDNDTNINKNIPLEITLPTFVDTNMDESSKRIHQNAQKYQKNKGY